MYDFKPYYRGAKISVIGGISLKKVLAVMTLNGSMDGDAYKIFIEHFLLPQLWIGAVVVMDNLPAHQVEEIKPLIESVGARVTIKSVPETIFSKDYIWSRWFN
ncbi:transposase [Nostoc sp. FACHB-973]|nr:transposase [Nostoc sp. FACHB-973]